MNIDQPAPDIAHRPKPVDPILTAPPSHRFLTRGEILKEGDKLLFGDNWIKLTELSIGQTVKNYAGYVRRSVTRHHQNDVVKKYVAIEGVSESRPYGQIIEDEFNKLIATHPKLLAEFDRAMTEHRRTELNMILYGTTEEPAL